MFVRNSSTNSIKLENWKSYSYFTKRTVCLARNCKLEL